MAAHALFSADPVLFFQKNNGKQVAIVDGFTFYAAAESDLRTIWRCTYGPKCKARFTYTYDHVILRPNFYHIHVAPKYAINQGIFVLNLQFVKKKNGKDLAIINGYTFYCHRKSPKNQIWSCTMGWNSEFHIGPKGTQQVLYRGQKFYKRGDNGGKVRWCCTKRWCTAVIYSVGNAIVKVKDKHFHPSTRGYNKDNMLQRI
ncbi:unnamed protein product [Colias eurytheme]|nr:unnamed protein product [Colias eurytheme]